MNNIFTAIASFFEKWFDKNNRWSRKNKSMMRETSPNDQRGCVRTANYQPKGRKYAKGASGSIGIGVDPKFNKSAFCRGLA